MSSNTSKQMTFWLTRDSDMEGKLDDNVDVWLSRPTRFVMGDGAVWMCEDAHTVPTANGDVPARYAVWTPEQCLRACRVYPETDRESIRVGE